MNLQEHSIIFKHKKVKNQPKKYTCVYTHGIWLLMIQNYKYFMQYKKISVKCLYQYEKKAKLVLWKSGLLTLKNYTEEEE